MTDEKNKNEERGTGDKEQVDSIDQIDVIGDENIDDKMINDKRKKHSFFSHDCKNCEKSKKEAEEYKAGWQRATADYQNLKSEVEKMRGEWVRMSEQQILEDFIPVYDNFKKAFAHHPDLNEDDKKVKGWIDGIGFIMKQFESVLKNHEVEEIITVGEIFNPELHEAVGEAHEPESEDSVQDKNLEEGTILSEVETGYVMKGKVIKVAKVIVNKK